MNGLLFIDKPEGLTSHDVTHKVSLKLHTKKVGHTGTLDPMATGVLVLCVGTYTKLVSLLTSSDKTYVFTMKFGVETDTGDITGNTVSTSNIIPSEGEIVSSMFDFPREYEQTVPIYSAVKVNGKRLYEYARNGENVELPKRMVSIYNMQLLNVEDDEATFLVSVSKGTYIRSLVVDIAKSLHTLGVMTSLRRVKQGSIDISQCISLDEVSSDKLYSVKDIFDYEEYDLSDMEYKRVENGNELSINNDSKYIVVKYKKKDIAFYEKNDSKYQIIMKL